MEPETAPSRRIFACLGDASRFRVMNELLQGEQCVSDLATRVGLSQSCTTRHLQALEREGLVRSIRQGKRVIFSVSTEPRVVALLAWAVTCESEPVRGGRGPRGVPDSRLEDQLVASDREKTSDDPNHSTPLEESSEEERRSTTRHVVSELEDFLL